MNDRTVLYVGADTGMDEPLRKLTERNQHAEPRTARSCSEAVEIVREDDVDCVVTEYELPDGTGPELIEQLRERFPEVGCILYADAGQGGALQRKSGPLAEFVPRDSRAGVTRLVQLVGTTINHRTQRAYPLPRDEDARLDAIDRYEFDDERLLAALERIAELAGLHCGAETAFVNIVYDDALCAAASHGIEEFSFPRSLSVCTYTILHEELTVVEDVSTDPRFDSLDLEEKYQIRFYAGAPLVTTEGHGIGTLCVLDSEPRALSETARRSLGLLAEEAMAWIEQCGRTTQLRPESAAQPNSR